MAAPMSRHEPLCLVSAPATRTEPDAWELVDEALRTFGEEAARTLAGHLAVSFDACRLRVAFLESPIDVRDRCDRF